MIRNRMPWSLAALAALLAGLAGCRSSEPPVATLEASPGHLVLLWPEFKELQLTLEPLRPLPPGEGQPIVFVHLLDEPGSVVRTFDHPLPQPWRVGHKIEDRLRIYQSALAEPLEPGQYLLSVGIYRSGSERFPLRTEGQQVSRYEYRVASVDVRAPSDQMPHARFSDAWLPPEPGADLQVLARRALRGGVSGTIQFGPVDGAGRLLATLEIPREGGTGARLEMLDGTTLPKVRLTSSCGGGQPEVSGAGRVDVELEIPPAAGPRICEVTITPNFQLTSADRAESTSVILEELSWERATGAPGD
jgi:hypothetical protein